MTKFATIDIPGTQVTISEDIENKSSGNVFRTERTGQPKFQDIKDLLCDRPLRRPNRARALRPAWLGRVAERIDSFLKLPENWNSYGAKAIKAHFAKFAGIFVQSVAEPSLPEPSVVPTVQGGVQVEWHTRGIDLEVRFEAGDRISVSFEDRREGLEWQSEFKFNDVNPLPPILAKLCTRR
jgi:hypothetical protein